MVRLPHLLALLCGLAAALAVGCGDRSNLIPSSRAAELTQQLASIKAAMDAGQCDGLMTKVDTFHDDATNLSSSVDTRLRKRLNQGAVSLQSHALATCQAHADEQQQASDTAPSDTIPPDTQTDTQPTETSTETTPTVPPTDTSTDTVPTTPTPTTPVTPTTPDTGGGTGTTTTPSDNGGTSPDGETP
ncbi:MAG: hypothetical protein JWQ18_3621 [Conexibacter sp.]|nr:hypothetical protein [Conexibacter sp.]